MLRRLLLQLRLPSFAIVALCFLCSRPAEASGGGGRLVSTRYGQLQGLRIQVPERAAEAAAAAAAAAAAGVQQQREQPELVEVDAFLGVEYASLMGGALRFMPPSGPAEKWRGVRLATAFRPVCPQRRINESALDASGTAGVLPAARLERLRRIAGYLRDESEECLFLNLYVPAVVATAATETPGKLAVVVFVHGESYEFGTGNAYDGSVLASYGQVIVITLNYRLGPLGFLSGTEGMTGNYALFDLIAALHWIKANIDDFGGDRERVTVVGQGYGAALVHLLALSPVVKDMGLFHRAILQSGTALSTWSLNKNPKKTFEVVTQRAGCAGAENKKECLRLVSTQLLMDSTAAAEAEASFAPAAASQYWPSPQPLVGAESGPTLDGSVLFPSPTPFDAGSGSALSRMELMVGVTRSEALSLLGQMQLERGVDATTFGAMLRRLVADSYSSHQREIYEILSHQYSSWERSADDGPETDAEIRDKLVELLGDALYVSPAVKASLAHAAAAAERDTFFYVFAHSSDEERYPEWSGGAHGEELPFLFGAPLLPQRHAGSGAGAAEQLSPFAAASYTPGERLLSEAVMRMWTNFAKTGNPNFPSTGVEAQNAFSELFWPKYERQRQDYFYFGMRPAVHHHYRNRKVALWLQLVTRLQQYAAEDELSDDAQGRPFDRDGVAAGGRGGVDDGGSASRGDSSGGPRGLEVRHAVLVPIPPPPPPPFLTSVPPGYGSSSISTADGTAKPLAVSADPAVALVPASTVRAAARGEWSGSRSRPATSRAMEATTRHPDGMSGVNSVDGEDDDVVIENGTGVSPTDAGFSVVVTVIVGCSLLVVNVVILGVVIYWRRRRAAARGKYYIDDNKDRAGGGEVADANVDGCSSSSSPLRPGGAAMRHVDSSNFTATNDGHSTTDAGACRRNGVANGGDHRPNVRVHQSVSGGGDNVQSASRLRRDARLAGDNRPAHESDGCWMSGAVASTAARDTPRKHCNGSLSRGDSGESNTSTGGERRRRGVDAGSWTQSAFNGTPRASRDGECDSSSEQGITVV